MALEIPPGMTYAQFRAYALELPALESPNGVHNYINPPNLVDWPYAISMWVLGSILVFIRLYTKLGVVKKVLIEDYFLLATWLVYAGAWIPLVIIMVKLPLGVHQWDMTVRSLIRHLYYMHVAIIAYCVTMMLLKVSILLQIIRIFTPSHTRKYTHWLLLTFMWINVLFYSILILFLSFSCKPIAKAWDPLIQGGHCNPHERGLVHIVSAAIDTASDVIILILPQPIIWSLNMYRRKKWGLSAVFLVGIFACVSSAVRIYYATILSQTEDITYWVGRMGKWAEPEVTAGFIVACLPVVPTFIKHLARTTLISTISSSLRSRSLSSKWTTKNPSLPYSSRTRSQGNRKITKEVVTDIEFHELVGRSRTEMGSVRSEGGGSADLEGGRVHGSAEMVIEKAKMGR